MSKFDDQKAYPYELVGYAILALGILLGLLAGITVSALAGILLLIPIASVAAYLIVEVKRRFEQGKTAFPFGVEGLITGKKFTVSHSGNIVYLGSLISEKQTVVSEVVINPDNLESLLLHLPTKGDGNMTLMEVPTIPDIADMLDQQPAQDRNHRLVSSKMVDFYLYLLKNQPGRTQCIAIHGTEKMVRKHRFGPGILTKELSIPELLKKIIRYEGGVRR